MSLCVMCDMFIWYLCAVCCVNYVFCVIGLCVFESAVCMWFVVNGVCECVCCEVCVCVLQVCVLCVCIWKYVCSI